MSQICPQLADVMRQLNHDVAAILATPSSPAATPTCPGVAAVSAGESEHAAYSSPSACPTPAPSPALAPPARDAGDARGPTERL